MTAGTLTVDDLTFRLRRSARRKTLEITVDRDGSLLLSAPEGTAAAPLERFVREKRFWIYEKLARKEALRHPEAAKEYVNGEGFPYLGRSYRLLLVDAQDRPLKLEAGRFRLLRSEVRKGRARFIEWYVEHGRPWLARKVGRWAPRVGVEPSGLEVCDLGYRWGSCGKAGLLHFHWAAVLLPAPIIEYILVHEPVHLV